MPRIRTLKPEIWQSQDFVALDNLGKLTFIALITLADDEGRVKTDAHHLAVTCLHGNRAPAIEKALSVLVQRRMLVIYRHRETIYMALVNWSVHQRVSHATPSRIPPPPESPESSGGFASAPEDSGASARARADRSIGSDLSMHPPNPPSPGGMRAERKPTQPMSPRAVELVQGFQALGYAQPSASDRMKAEEYVTELTVLTVPEMLARMAQHLEWCEQNRKPRPATLGGFWKTLRMENDYRRDNGASPASSREPPNGRMTSIGDIMRRDPDDE